MSRSDLLFFEPDLDDQLRAQTEGAREAVERVGTEQFMVSTDDEVVEHIVSRFSVLPPQLHEDSQSMEQEETRVDVSGDSSRVFSPGRSGPFYIPGTRVAVKIPFSGAAWVFKLRTNPYWSSFPRAKLIDAAGGTSGWVSIEITAPHDADPTEFKSRYERQLGLLRDCVQAAAAQVEAYNERLPDVVRSAVDARRQRLEKHGEIAKILDIPLTQRDDAPSIEPVKIEVRRPPALPVPPKSGLHPEPGIAPDTYEHILHFIRHQGRTFETTPGTYRGLNEEELRNVILAQLNGHFKGLASGEAFRGRGKTDIRIEQDDRAAFVGECKVWTGTASAAKAMSQLLSYLTWRDGKAALIVFNKDTKDFSIVLDRLPHCVRTHELFVRDIECNERGEWRVLVRSAEDEGRRVTLHVFAFNLYAEDGLKPRRLGKRL